MIGIPIEASTTCPKCGEQAAINAMVPRVLCMRCGEVMTLSVDDWNTILADALQEAPSMEEGEGRNLKIFSDPYSFKVLYGRQAPQFRDTKKPMDMNEAIGHAEEGFILDRETKTRRSVRVIPPEYRTEFPGVTHLLCEDFDQLPGAGGGSGEFRFPKSEGPRPYACPQCGGSLEVDGSARMVKCIHCDTSLHIPDDLWLNLHPSKLVSRWYLWFDESLRPYQWDGDLWDIISDKEGNLYFTHASPQYEKFTLVSLGPDLKPRWMRNDLDEYAPKTSNGNPKLSIGPEGKLFLWSGDTNALLTLSCADGTELDRLGGSRGRAAAGGGTFSMKETVSMASDIDGTIVTYKSRNKKDVDENFYSELLRYSADGDELPFWPVNTEKVGFLGKVKAFFKDYKGPAWFSNIGDYQINIFGGDVILSVGFDGFYYFLDFTRLARFDRTGRMIFNIELPCGLAWGRACGDANGFAFVLCKGKGDDNFILRVSPMGDKVSVHVPYVTRGGSICSEEALAMSPDGSLYAAGYDGRFRSFSPDGKLLHASDKSKKDEAEALIKAKKEDE